MHARLRTAGLTVLGQLLDSSNTTLLSRLEDCDDSDDSEHVIYKPVAGERPLWDFPDGHLAYREVATWLVATAGGWDVVPPTVWRDGPFGPGSVQRWVTAVPTDAPSDSPEEEGEFSSGEEHAPGEEIEVDTDVERSDRFVGLFDPAALPQGWLPVLSGRLAAGGHVVVAHADRADLRSVAVLDAAINNSDRKGSHLLTGLDGRLWCIDHGVTLHQEDKLRTVLWGWAGQPIPEADLERLERLRVALEPSSALAARLGELLTRVEAAALRRRVRDLLTTQRHPMPSPDWPCVPWPAL
nr:SCO1664 family protein [Kineosphaera limosa]